MITEKGAMSWMSPNMKMETSTNGGIGKAFGRMFSGESIFQNTYTAKGGHGMFAFASSFPGKIVAHEVAPGREIVVQKSGFLAAEAGVDLSIFFQKRIGSGIFGGEGFIMQKLSGRGMAFLEFDGHVVEYELQPGQQIVVDTGYLAAMDATCSMEIQSVPGVKNMLFGGEGVFNTVISGPGTKPCTVSAAKSSTIEPLTGTPRPSEGISSPEFEAFCAASLAPMPSMEPWPNSSGFFEIICAA